MFAGGGLKPRFKSSLIAVRTVDREGFFTSMPRAPSPVSEVDIVIGLRGAKIDRYEPSTTVFGFRQRAIGFRVP